MIRQVVWIDCDDESCRTPGRAAPLDQTDIDTILGSGKLVLPAGWTREGNKIYCGDHGAVGQAPTFAEVDAQLDAFTAQAKNRILSNLRAGLHPRIELTGTGGWVSVREDAPGPGHTDTEFIVVQGRGAAATEERFSDPFTAADRVVTLAGWRDVLKAVI